MLLLVHPNLTLEDRIALVPETLGSPRVLTDGRRTPKRLVLKLVDKQRIADAKVRLLEAIDRSAVCRLAYLAETDDDREWVANPRPKKPSHAARSSPSS
jgi:hypothetical protein